MSQPAKRSERSEAVDPAKAGRGPWRIHVAAELSGVAPTTLRAWERRYGIPVPRRTTSAYRLYSADDVSLIARMRGLVASGMAPAEAARTLLSGQGDLSVVEDSPDRDVLDLARERLLAATQRWDAHAIDEELLRLSFLVDAQTLYAKLVSPLVVEVGERWERGELSVAQEHLLSEKLELVLRAILRTLDRQDGPHVLFAAIDGDQHVIGLLGAAIRFAAGGARVTVLGASTPASAIADAVKSLSPRLVGLSVTTPPRGPRTLFKQYAKACGHVRWVVGGPSAMLVESVVMELGGAVATGAVSAWSPHVREWLRGV